MKYKIGDYFPSDDDFELVNKVILSRQLSEGPLVKEFENAWAQYIGTKYCVAFSSGSTALLGGLLAAKYLGLLKGDAILTNPITHIATVNAINFAGFKPIFSDIEPDSIGKLSIDGIRSTIENTNSFHSVAAIIPVHLFGLPEDLISLIDLANSYNIPLIEDVAQGAGSTFHSRQLGSWGLFGIFSFYVSHTLNAVEMGAITTDNPELVEYLISVKRQGCRSNNYQYFFSECIGLNFKTSELHAAIALSSLKQFSETIQKRQSNAIILSNRLQKWSNILRIPHFLKGTCPFAFPIVVTDETLSRDKICENLGKLGIETRPMFPCIPNQQPSYGKLRPIYSTLLPNADYFARKGFYIGCHQYLTMNDIESIANIIDLTLNSVNRR